MSNFTFFKIKSMIFKSKLMKNYIYTKTIIYILYKALFNLIFFYFSYFFIINL